MTAKEDLFYFPIAILVKESVELFSELIDGDPRIRLGRARGAREVKSHAAFALQPKIDFDVLGAQNVSLAHRHTHSRTWRISKRRHPPLSTSHHFGPSDTRVG